MSLPECNKEALPELPEYKKRMAPNPTGALTKNVNNNFRRISFILRKVWSYRTDAKPLRKIRNCLTANVDPSNVVHRDSGSNDLHQHGSEHLREVLGEGLRAELHHFVRLVRCASHSRHALGHVCRVRPPPVPVPPAEAVTLWKSSRQDVAGCSPLAGSPSQQPNAFVRAYSILHFDI